MRKQLLAVFLLQFCWSIPGAGQAAKVPAIDGAALRAAGSPNDPHAGEWLSYGRTQGETRYSPLKQIDATNVKRLGLAWTYTLGSGGGNQEGTPLVWNNTIYGITSWSVVFAVDARTGKQLWRWDPEVNQLTTRPRICCGIVNRGLAIYQGKIFAPVIDGRLVALDAETGKVQWEARLGYNQDYQAVTMAPRIAGNKVVIGVAGGDHPTRGFVDAYDTANGHRLWRFYTVPGDPAKPYEDEAQRAAAKTWGGDFYKMGGGGAVWDGMAYDAANDLIYIGTGNAEPWVQKFRGAQNVDNLYTCSILGIQASTGKLKWYYQTVPNDNWDFDSVQQLMLADLTVRGRPRKVLMQAAKNGFFYIIDRVSGEFISAEPFVQVNWARGIDDRGKPMVNPEAFYDKEPVTIYPTAGGAHNWAPMSFHPGTGLIYIPATYASWTFQAGDEVLRAPTGDTGLTRAFLTARPNAMKMIGPEPPEKDRGVLEAWNPVEQKMVWRQGGGGGIGGGTVATAGNLVFQVTNNGLFRAFSADKGEKLFEAQMGRTGMAPPITYEIDGKQYVAFLGGMGETKAGPTGATVEHPPLMFVFALDGKAEMPKPAPPPPPLGPPPPPAEAPHN